jgi:hypothetical protein
MPHDPLLRAAVAVHGLLLTARRPRAGGRPIEERSTSAPPRAASPDTHDDAGQATSEYALVMLGAAAIALLVITWATSGGGGGRIGQLFDRVVDSITSRIG